MPRPLTCPISLPPQHTNVHCPCYCTVIIFPMFFSSSVVKKLWLDDHHTNFRVFIQYQCCVRGFALFCWVSSPVKPRQRFSLLLIVHVIGAELTLTFHSFFSSNSLIQLYWVVAYRDSDMSLSSFQKNSSWALFFKKSTWQDPLWTAGVLIISRLVLAVIYENSSVKDYILNFFVILNGRFVMIFN
jgi:hypothetical protein